MSVESTPSTKPRRKPDVILVTPEDVEEFLGPDSSQTIRALVAPAINAKLVDGERVPLKQLPSTS